MSAKTRGKGNLTSLLVGMQIGAAITGNNMEISQKIKNRTTTWSSNATLRYILEEKENSTSKRCLHPSVYKSIIYSRQDKEAS